ncbi:tyrosine-type recombinase/integrase [Thiocapsa marina]|uniref:Integrase family protein n=1 Tax=Thiocapsa marina 5811 TaxID=768671 RepID=F9UAL8_9GAMM|nr:integrase arm-type DNA-binding domain-containing protein [Thiocapsa marina]EGV18770.1 integrase family protein [Thiocapsa marina 5811]
MPLTDAKVRNAKPAGKMFKLYDERGLFLMVAPEGGKLWRFRYRIDGKEKLLALGGYPDVGLKEARERRDDARKLLAAGVDPGAARKAQKAARIERATNSFEVIAREWFAKNESTWAPSHSTRVLRRMERDIFPWIGGSPIADLKAPEILATVRRIAERGALETAHRALSDIGQVFRFAISTSRADSDVTRDLRGALPTAQDGHFTAVTDPVEVGALLRALWGYEGTLTVKCALRLAPLVFVRPGELRAARWADFDLDAAEWRFTVSKTDTDLIVPLSRQAVEILREIEPATGNGEYVFPSARTPRRPMSDNAILSAMRRMGIPKETATGHGLRATARTLLDEGLKYRPDLIEHQLAHAVRDANGRAYNRTSYLDERRAMMQEWSDYLDKLRIGANVPPGAA